MSREGRHFINGAWTANSSEETLNVSSARTGQSLGTIPGGSHNEVNLAVTAARTAQPGWAALPAAERAEYLRAIAAGIRSREDEVVALVAEEIGCVQSTARMMQVGAAAAVFDDAALHIEEVLMERTLGNSRIIQQPLGVIAAITPWNFPLYQAALKVAPALAVGCTVVLKPSEVAPFTASVLAEIIEGAGLPAGAFNLVHGTGPNVGETLVSHPEVDAVTFTGSDIAGARVAQLAGSAIKPVTLELGGKNPHLILDCTDLAAAVAYSVASAFANNGQVCAALGRLIVPREYLPEVERLAKAEAQKFVPGDPNNPQTRLGPLASAGQLNRLKDILERAIKEGTDVLTGGTDRPAGLSPELAGGFFATPTVFTNVAPGSVIDQEEAFGPVLAIVPYDGGMDEGIRIANGTPYGLNAAVWSDNEELANLAATRLNASTVYINGGKFNATSPFGGTKRSGFGRERGIAGLEEFVHSKSIQS